MGLIEKLFGNDNSKSQHTSDVAAEKESMADSSKSQLNQRTKTNINSKDVIDTMMAMADMEMSNGDYARAADSYKNILKLMPNEVAQYNLGTLYAQGKGVEQDFMEGAYWFHQAELSGDNEAGILCVKCSIDFTFQNFEEKTPWQVYDNMVKFIKYVYPETADVNLEVCRKLYSIAGNHFNKKNYSTAAKLFRAAAEFGNDGYSQNYLAVLYNAGVGLKKNDLASLYWFDKAVDNGAADIARTDRDGILNSYKKNFNPAEFYEEMMKLSAWCSIGNEDVPKDAIKSTFWRQVGENIDDFGKHES